MGIIECEQARAAFKRGGWEVGFEGWSAADTDALPAAELEDLATAAELLGRHDEAVGALQQAFVYWEGGNPARAGGCAFRRASPPAPHGEPAMFAGWTSRAEGLIAEIGDDGPERGW